MNKCQCILLANCTLGSVLRRLLLLCKMQFTRNIPVLKGVNMRRCASFQCQLFLKNSMAKLQKNLNPLKIDRFILIQISTVIRRSLKPNNEAIYCGAFDHRPNKPTFRTSIH